MSAKCRPCWLCRDPPCQKEWAKYKNGEADGLLCKQSRNYVEWRFKGANKAQVASDKKKFALEMRNDELWKEHMEGPYAEYKTAAAAGCLPTAQSTEVNAIEEEGLQEEDNQGLFYPADLYFARNPEGVSHDRVQEDAQEHNGVLGFWLDVEIWDGRTPLPKGVKL